MPPPPPVFDSELYTLLASSHSTKEKFYLIDATAVEQNQISYTPETASEHENATKYLGGGRGGMPPEPLEVTIVRK